MSSSLRGRDLISAADLLAEDVTRRFARAARLRAEDAIERHDPAAWPGVAPCRFAARLMGALGGGRS